MGSAPSREKGKHNKGREPRHRTVDEAERKSLFAKPSLDEMGPGTDLAKPASAVSRATFKKQTHSEAHGADYGVPGDSDRSLFRKNTLDEMTVRRTEKPIDGAEPVKRQKIGIGSHEDPAGERARGRRSKKSGRPGR